MSEPQRKRRSKHQPGNYDGVMYCVACGDDVWTRSYDRDTRDDILHFQRCIPCIAKGQAAGTLGAGLQGDTYHEGKP